MAAREYEPAPDDEREEKLSDEQDPPLPPTIDPEERIEVEDEDDAPLDDDRLA